MPAVFPIIVRLQLNSHRSITRWVPYTCSGVKMISLIHLNKCVYGGSSFLNVLSGNWTSGLNMIKWKGKDVWGLPKFNDAVATPSIFKISSHDRKEWEVRWDKKCRAAFKDCVTIRCERNKGNKKKSLERNCGLVKWFSWSNSWSGKSGDFNL